MDTCQRCKSRRIMDVSGHCQDRCVIEYDDNGYDGYVPFDMPLNRIFGQGDYLSFSVCLDCGQMQGAFPISESDMDKALKIERPDMDGEPDDIESEGE